MQNPNPSKTHAELSITQWIERYRGYLAFGVILVAAIGFLLFQALRPEPEPIRFITPSPQPEPKATPTPMPLRVYVSGAVHNPDVYQIPHDSIVKDAIMAAGGATEQADLDRINLAAPVSDGQHIYVPHVGEETLPVEPPSNQPAASTKVNINTADSSALETLPGIGPSIAQRIIAHRQENGPFAKIEDIMDVSGIGPATFEKLREHITTD